MRLNIVAKPTKPISPQVPKQPDYNQIVICLLHMSSSTFCIIFIYSAETLKLINNYTIQDYSIPKIILKSSFPQDSCSAFPKYFLQQLLLCFGMIAILNFISVPPYIIHCSTQHQFANVHMQRLLFPFLLSKLNHLIPIISRIEHTESIHSFPPNSCTVTTFEKQVFSAFNSISTKTHN